MGYRGYDLNAREVRASSLDYFSGKEDVIFKQTKEGKMHDSMNPKGISFRESRDSAQHPNSYPVIFALDLTGSMSMIPNDLIKEGLPKLVSKIIQAGTPDLALLFLGVGDHETDSAPLQVGQFESGDEELDTWLTRLWLEKGGGSNEGESYLLAHYFAAFHTSTDSFEKRNKKGVLFTCGDEPGLPTLPSNVIKEVMGTSQATTLNDVQLLEKASEKYHVYHIHVNHGYRNGYYSEKYWKTLLGQNFIVTNDYTKIPEIVANIVIKHSNEDVEQKIQVNSVSNKVDIDSLSKQEIIL